MVMCTCPHPHKSSPLGRSAPRLSMVDVAPLARPLSMPPPIASFPRLSILCPAEAIYLAKLRREIRLLSSRLLYIRDGGHVFYLPRHHSHTLVTNRRGSRMRLAVARRRSMADLPKEYRALVRRRIFSLRSALLNGVTLRTISLRTSLPVSKLSSILNGGIGSRRLTLTHAVLIADAAGVKVRTLAAYLRRVHAIRRRAIASSPILPYSLGSSGRDPLS